MLQVLHLILLFAQCLCNQALQVQITNGLQNITVQEGESATFSCNISGASTPIWIIAISYSVIDLPLRHFYNSSLQQLTVRNVTVSDDGTTYQCAVFPNILSNTAVLMVNKANFNDSTDSMVTMSTSSPPPTSVPNMTASEISPGPTSVVMLGYTTPDAYIDDTNIITVQIHLTGITNCNKWINRYNHSQIQDDVTSELTVYIEQRCNCTFPSALITRAHFTCPPFQPSPPHPQHVTYRASIGATGQLNRSMLEAVLREWPALHKAILLQGELLSVDHTCPVIISSSEDEDCNHMRQFATTFDTTQEDSSNTNLFNIPFLATMACSVVITMLAMAAIAILSFYMLKYKKAVNTIEVSSQAETGNATSNQGTSPPDPARLPAPEYEEIQELRETRKSDAPIVPHDHAAREDYEFTECPAYTTSRV